MCASPRAPPLERTKSTSLLGVGVKMLKSLWMLGVSIEREIVCMLANVEIY